MKTVRHKTYHVSIDGVAIPRELLKLKKYLTLMDHVMFVNNIPFMITISLGIRFKLLNM